MIAKTKRRCHASPVAQVLKQLAPALLLAVGLVMTNLLCPIPAAYAQAGPGLVPTVSAHPPGTAVPPDGVDPTLAPSQGPPAQPRAKVKPGGPGHPAVNTPDVEPPSTDMERNAKKVADHLREANKSVFEVLPALLSPARVAAMLVFLIGYVAFYFRRQARVRLEAEQEAQLSPAEKEFGSDPRLRRGSPNEVSP